LHLIRLTKKAGTDSGENISKDYWLEGVKKTVFRPNSLLFVQQSPFKLLPFHAEKNSASSKTNQKASSTDSNETISKDYWLDGVKKTVFRPNLPLFG
jgi:hypothetical protein